MRSLLHVAFVAPYFSGGSGEGWRRARRWLSLVLVLLVGFMIGTLINMTLGLGDTSFDPKPCLTTAPGTRTCQ